MPADASPLADRCAIAVMAKAPGAGRVKTRLVPPLDHDEATELSACFLADVTAAIARAAHGAPIDGFVAYAPAGSEAVFQPMIAPGTRLVLADGSPAMANGIDGIGRCLLHAAEALFAHGYGAVCLLNADSPTLPTAVLVDAARALAEPGERIVLGAAEDGGYYLIGMTTAHAHLFDAVAWSTARVADQTRARIAALGLERRELPRWYDVDDVPTLRRLCAELGGAATRAPATARWLAQVGLARRLAAAAAPVR